MEGTDWVNNNQFGDPTTPHAGARMTKGGVLHSNEAFAIDFIRFVGGTSHSGDGSANEDYYAWGAPILSSSAGVVVTVRDGLPAEPPGAFANDLTDIDDAGGTIVVVKAAEGVFVYYAHLQSGSIPVKPGDRVKVGQRLGLLGNSGNTTGPHLHFQVASGPDVMASESVPFVFTSFTQTARIILDEAGNPSLERTAKRFTNVYPTTLGIFTLP